MAYIDAQGILHECVNDPLILRMLKVLLIPQGYISLLILIAIFFVLKYYIKNKKILMLYVILAAIGYILFMLLYSRLFMCE